MPDTEVLIVGGGPVGLAMALLLGRFEIPCVLVEQHATTTTYPKARALMSRSMEMFRQLGIEKNVRAHEALDTGIVLVESMSGRVIARVAPERPTPGVTPCWKSTVVQNAVEEELFAAATRCPHVELRFFTRFVGLEQTEDLVIARLADLASGSEHTLTARYVIAADGAGSDTRGAAGIEMRGPTFGAALSQYWRADLSAVDASAHDFAFFIYSDNPVVPLGTSVISDRFEDHWLSVFHVGIDANERDARPLTDQEMIEIIRAQVGVPDLDVELRGWSVWRISNQLADTYRSGSVFLVGDAAHLMPPSGGFGLNTGLQDAHNLAWKLAFVIKGLADPGLLDTYELERRDVAISNADWSVSNAPRFLQATRKGAVPALVEAVTSGDPDRIGFWVTDMENHVHSVGRALGFTYERGAVIPDGSAVPPFNSRVPTQTDRPGARFPHMWVDLGRQRSTLDWFDTEFVLVTGPMGDSWLDAADKVASTSGIPLVARRLPSADRSVGFSIGLRGAALVRPDGHVAWRRCWASTDPEMELAEALAWLGIGRTTQKDTAAVASAQGDTAQ